MTRPRISDLLLLLVLALAPSACTGWFFSTGVVQPDSSRPVALIELRGKPAQLGATTEEGILFLNPDDAAGACRVHYFLGPDLIVEDGSVGQRGGGYALADIDLKTQAVPVLTRDPTPDDELVALVLAGDAVERVPVSLATDPVAKGYALSWPGVELPLGAGIFRVRTGRNAGGLQFVGLASGQVSYQAPEGTRRFVTFTGPARMREALATPRPIFEQQRIVHRPDGISVRK